MESFSRAVRQYDQELNAVAAKHLTLTDANYDVGVVTPVGQYFMDDETQAYWLHKLAEKHFATVDKAIRQHLTGYFGDLSAEMKVKHDPAAWKQLQSDYANLKAQTN